MEVVLDTNVAVSAIINRKGTPGRILDLWRQGRFGLVISSSLMVELESTLRSKHLQRFVETSEVEELIDRIRQAARVVRPAEELRIVESDPADNRVLEAAVEGEVDYIVTGDNDLLRLGEFEGISIITPARFLAIVSSNL